MNDRRYREKLVDCALEYCEGKNLTKKEAMARYAKFLKISYGGLKKWVDGTRTPPLRDILRIERLTEGRMSLEDWYKRPNNRG